MGAVYAGHSVLDIYTSYSEHTQLRIDSVMTCPGSSSLPVWWPWFRPQYRWRINPETNPNDERHRESRNETGVLTWVELMSNTANSCILHHITDYSCSAWCRGELPVTTHHCICGVISHAPVTLVKSRLGEDPAEARQAESHEAVHAVQAVQYMTVPP